MTVPALGSDARGSGEVGDRAVEHGQLLLDDSIGSDHADRVASSSRHEVGDAQLAHGVRWMPDATGQLVREALLLAFALVTAQSDEGVVM